MTGQPFDRERVRVGDRVRVNDPKYPGVWIVREFLVKNIKLEPETGGRGLKCPRWMLTDPESAPPTGPFGRPYVQIPPLGSLVVCSDPRTHGYFVVIGGRNGRVNIAQLGGDGDRYWRMSPTTLTVIDPDTVIAAVPGQAPPASAFSDDALATELDRRLAATLPPGNGHAPGRGGLRLVTDADAPPAPPVPAPAPAGKGAFRECGLCGYTFPAPRASARCNSTKACQARQAKRRESS